MTKYPWLINLKTSTLRVQSWYTYMIAGQSIITMTKITFALQGTLCRMKYIVCNLHCVLRSVQCTTCSVKEGMHEQVVLRPFL